MGHDLQYIPKADIQIKDQKFAQIKINSSISKDTLPTNKKSIDCQGLLMIPGFVNCHTHIGDSIGKDFTLDSSVDKKIHPVFGAKSRILSKTQSKHLVSFMRHSCQSMLQKGITTFVDFRENGIEGISLFKDATKSLPIRSVVLGRMNLYHDAQQIKANAKPLPAQEAELKALLKKCDGLGISGANENSDALLQYYYHHHNNLHSRSTTSNNNKILAIHAAETKQSVAASMRITKKSEVSRALQHLKPHFLVHMTFATKQELALAAKKTRGIVICPRANAALAEGIPDFELMRKTGCTLALGTDNVMVNSPDMFREMDYLWKVSMGIKKHRIDPKFILQMATTNAATLLPKKNIGVISKGKLADAIFLDKHTIDLDPMHNPHAAIVHRASETAIRAVMIGGKIVHGKI